MAIAPVDCAASMDVGIFSAFAPGGSFEGLLDHLTVNTMNYARQVDGTTPLMAACARGHRPLVELLLDLGCHTMLKDERGWTALQHAAASPVQQDLCKLILDRTLPPLDANGKPVHTWDTCDHPLKSRFLDEELGWLICTNCALVLDEHALTMAGEPIGDSKNPWKVKGADSEYNAWRHDEMEIADAMQRLGVVDNQVAKLRGLETSVWKQRERALAWLDKRRRVILSWRDEVRMAQSAEKRLLPPLPAIPDYPAEIKALSCPSPRLRERNHELLNAAPVKQRRFKGNKEKSIQHLLDEDEEEELIDPLAMQQALGDPFELVAKWRTWYIISHSLQTTSFYREI